MNHPLFIGCIADDFTGGSDAASFLQKAGLNTILVNGEHLQEDLLRYDPEALVVALKSRSIPSEEAVAQTTRAARWLLEHGAQHLYFKYCSTFDSTPAGNIGPVTDALLELTDQRYTVLCPSLPINGRTVRNGVLYVNGVPLAETSMRVHPVNPMRKSDLTELMREQSAYPCVWLTADQMRAAEWKPAAGRCTLVPSYETDEDGRKIAEVFGHLRLLTGGSGLLRHLGEQYLAGRPGTAAYDGSPAVYGAPRLLLAGSCSSMTQKQVRHYLDRGGKAIRIYPDRLLSGTQTEEQLRQAIAGTNSEILLYSTSTPEEVRRCQESGAEQISAILEALMGRLAVYGLKRGFRRLVVAGGETSGAVAQALDIHQYRIGKDAAPGVPELWPLERPELSLVLKSGNFGDEDFFLTALTSPSLNGREE